MRERPQDGSLTFGRAELVGTIQSAGLIKRAVFAMPAAQGEPGPDMHSQSQALAARHRPKQES